MCTVCGFCTNFLFRQIWSIGSKVMSDQSYVLKLCRSWPLCYESIRVASLNSRIFQLPDGVKRPLMSQITPRWILIRLYGVFWPIMPHSLVQNATKLKIHFANGRCFTNKSHFFYFIPKKISLIEIAQNTCHIINYWFQPFRSKFDSIIKVSTKQ